MAIQLEDYDPALKAGAVVNTSDDIALADGKIIVGNASGVGTAVTMSGAATMDNAGVVTLTSSPTNIALDSAHILVGDGTNVAADVAVTGDVTLTNAGVTTVTDLTIASEARGDILRRGATAWQRVSAKDSGKILVGDGTDVVSVSVSGDATLASTGAVTIAAGAVTNAKVADSTGAAGLAIRKSALFVYDFAVDGGAQGAIVCAGAPTIPDNAVVWVESYDVLTTFTSDGADAATVAVTFPTDGAVTTAIAISDGSNPWDAGAFAAGTGGLVTPLPKKLTGARVPGITVAGGNNLTAGKAVFQLAYWVSA